MTVQELVEELEGMNPKAEVRFAGQPSWPFEYSLAKVVGISSDDEDDSSEVETVYLIEGNQLGYLPDEVKDEIGW